MQKILTLATLLWATTLFTYAQSTTARPEVAKYCKVYRGIENLQITMVRVGPPSANEVLVEMVGIDHPWDGKIMKAKSVVDGKRDFVRVKNEGRDWNIATRPNDEQTNRWTIFLPNKGAKESEYEVVYSEGHSANCKPEHLLTAWLQSGRK